MLKSPIELADIQQLTRALPPDLHETFAQFLRVVQEAEQEEAHSSTEGKMTPSELKRSLSRARFARSTAQRSARSNEAWERFLSQPAANLSPRFSAGDVLLALYEKDDEETRAALIKILDTVPLMFGAWRGIKRIYKLAEARRDAEVFGVLAARFDEAASTYDSETDVSSGTLTYLRRRAWRYLRQLGKGSPELYTKFASEVLRYYRADVRKNNLWIANHIWAHGTKGYSGTGFYFSFDVRSVVKQRAFPDAWKRSPEPLMFVLDQCRNNNVAAFAIACLRADFPEQLRSVTSEWLIRFATSPLAAKHDFVIDIFENSPEYHQSKLKGLGLHDVVLGLLFSESERASKYATAYARANAKELSKEFLLSLFGSDDQRSTSAEVKKFAVSELKTRNARELGAGFWLKLLPFKEATELATTALNDAFTREELSLDVLRSALKGASTQLRWAKAYIQKKYPSNELPPAFWTGIVDSLTEEERGEYEHRPLLDAVFEALNQYPTERLDAKWLVDNLASENVGHRIVRLLSNASKLKGLDIEKVKGLVFRASTRSIALQLLGNTKLVKPRELGLPWLLALARRDDPTLHEFAHRYLLEHMRPEDFAEAGSSQAGIERLLTLALGEKEPLPVRQFAQAYLRCHHPTIGAEQPETKQFSLTPQLPASVYHPERIWNALWDSREDVRRFAVTIVRAELRNWGLHTRIYELADSEAKEVRNIAYDAMLKAGDPNASPTSTLTPEELDPQQIFALTENRRRPTREVAMELIRRNYARLGGAERLGWLMQSADREVRLFAVRLLWEKHRPRSLPAGWQPGKKGEFTLEDAGRFEDVKALRALLHRTLFGLPPGRAPESRDESDVKHRLSASTVKRNVIELVRDMGLSDVAFAALVAPVLEEFTGSLAKGEWQACLSALAHLRSAHPGLSNVAGLRMSTESHFEQVRAITGDGRHFIVGGTRATASSQITIIEAASSKVTAHIDVPSHVYGLTLAQTSIAAACSDGGVRLFDLQGKLLRELTAHAGAAHAIEAFAESSKLATAGADGVLRLHEVSSGKSIGEYKLSAKPLRAVAVDATSTYAAAAGDDGFVRVVTIATGELREMLSHEGAVTALAFTPDDGRIVSAGDDGQLRIFYLVGDTDFELRGNDNNGHEGAIRALSFLPRQKSKRGEDEGERFVTVGDDGKLKLWRLADRRKPRTTTVSSKPLHALAILPISLGSSKSLVLTAGDARTVYGFPIDGTGTPAESARTWKEGFDSIQAALAGNVRAAHESAIKVLAGLLEPESTELLIKALKTSRFPEAKAYAAQVLGETNRVDARADLRAALSVSEAAVRRAAYEALSKLNKASPITTPRAGLESSQADIRILALLDLAALGAQSPLAAGMIAGRLVDGDRGVRIAALDWYSELFPAGSTEPLKTAFERGPEDLRVEVLLRAAISGLAAHPDMSQLFTQAFDDASSDVRRAAFAIKVLELPRLAAALEARDASFARSVDELARQLAQRQVRLDEKGQPKPPTDENIKAAKAQLASVLSRGQQASGALVEEDLAPLLLAMACRTADTAIRGASGLADLGDTRALGALLQLSRDADKAIRVQAARSLQTLSDPRAKKRLIWMLDDADADVRGAALDAYGKLESSQLFLAEAALRSSQEDIRVRGLSLLVSQGKDHAAETNGLLGDALEDESSTVRSEAFRTLWSWHDKDPEKAIARALSARFPDLRNRAVKELEAHGKEEWALARLEATIADRDESVSLAAYNALAKLKGKKDSTAHIAGLGSLHAVVRAAAATAASNTKGEAVRSLLTKLLEDKAPTVRAAALESLDKLFPKEAGPLYVGLQSSFIDLRVLAAELLAERHDEQIIEPMRNLLADTELERTIERPALTILRYRAAKALASLGATRLLKYFATELLKDEDGMVREQAARGLSTSARKGDEGFLLDALGHADVAVRSWAAEGLSRLGDPRALPVLTGHLKHEHAPVRFGAILSFAALGPEGYGGMLQGLADPSKEVQEVVFLLILARDLRAFRKGESPDLLASALSAQRSEIRFAAARALELRSDPAAYMALLIEALLPPKPEKAADLKKWPDEERRARIMLGLAEGLASDLPEVRYAAARAVNLRAKPEEFFKEAEKVAKPRLASSNLVPENAPWSGADDVVKAKAGWLRRLFAEGADGEASTDVPDSTKQRLRWLAFGAYVGLLRQATSGDDEGQRVRRDAVDRIVELSLAGHVSHTASLPALIRSLDDPHHLVRRAAFAALKKLFPAGADEPLTFALGAANDDVARAALDELAARGESSKPRIAQALNARVAAVRKYAFELLEKLSPKGSLEPLIAALESEHADIRIGVLERLSTAHDSRVVAALVSAMRSEHADLRLRAAEMLARRRDDRGVEVLAAFLRSESSAEAERAETALETLASSAAVLALGERLVDAPSEQRERIISALEATKNEEAIPLLASRFGDEEESVRTAAFRAAATVAGYSYKNYWGSEVENEEARRADLKDYNAQRAMQFLPLAAKASHADVRLAAAELLAFGQQEHGQSQTLTTLFTDRDEVTRVQAVLSYAERVSRYDAPVAPLEQVLQEGRRELMLGAAEGVASRGGALAFRPLMLFFRAGEEPERERAIEALGKLGDLRALEEIEAIASNASKEVPSGQQAAGVRSLGPFFKKVTDAAAQARIFELIERSLAASNDALCISAMRALGAIGTERAMSKIFAAIHDGDIDSDALIVACRIVADRQDRAAVEPLARLLSNSSDSLQERVSETLALLLPDDPTRVAFLRLASDNDALQASALQYLAENGDAGQLLDKLPKLKEELGHRLLMGLIRRADIPEHLLRERIESDTLRTSSAAAWVAGVRAKTTISDALTQSLLAAEAKSERAWKQASSKDDQREAGRCWLDVMWALAQYGAKQALPRARALAVSKGAPAPVRREATRLLGRVGEKGDVQIVTSALRDESFSVRSAAAAALQKLAPASAMDTVMSVKPFDPQAFVYAGAGTTVDALLTEQGRSLLISRLLGARDGARLIEAARAAKDETSRLALLEAVGFSGDARVKEALKAISTDKNSYDETTRKTAYRALRRVARQVKKQSEAQA